MMHSCYRLMSGINGRQDAYYGANNVPSYEDIESALETDSTINTARISTLRSRYLMAATVSVGTCLYGRFIGLNYLASWRT